MKIQFKIPCLISHDFKGITSIIHFYLPTRANPRIFGMWDKLHWLERKFAHLLHNGSTSIETRFHPLWVINTKSCQGSKKLMALQSWRRNIGVMYCSFFFNLTSSMSQVYNSFLPKSQSQLQTRRTRNLERLLNYRNLKFTNNPKRGQDPHIKKAPAIQVKKSSCPE